MIAFARHCSFGRLRASRHPRDGGENLDVAVDSTWRSDGSSPEPLSVMNKLMEVETVGDIATEQLRRCVENSLPFSEQLPWLRRGAPESGLETLGTSLAQQRTIKVLAA